MSETRPKAKSKSRPVKPLREAAPALPAPEVLILSEEKAELYEPSGREVCISIHDPDKPPARLSDRFLALLRLAFTDITEPSGLEGDVLFNEDHALEIVRFITRWKKVDRIVIHCRAGLSRSPGVAIGLCELFSWGSVAELEQQHPLRNRFVWTEVVRIGRQEFQQGNDALRSSQPDQLG